MKDMTLGLDAIEWLGVQYRTILSTEDTGGAMSITEVVSPPRPGPPRHVHHDADEAFVMLGGDSEFWLDGQRIRRSPGETVLVPRTDGKPPESDARATRSVIDTLPRSEFGPCRAQERMVGANVPFAAHRGTGLASGLR